MSETVRQFTVQPDDDGVRLDRWFKVHFPQVTFAYLNKLTRTGQVRVAGARAKTNTRLEAEQEIRVPPLAFDKRPADTPKARELLDQLRPLAEEMLDEALDGMGADDRSCLMRLLDQMRRNLVRKPIQPEASHG